MRFSSATLLVLVSATKSIEGFSIVRSSRSHGRTSDGSTLQRHRQEFGSSRMRDVNNYHRCGLYSTADDAVAASSESTSSSQVQVKRLENSSVSVEIPVPGKATQAAYDKVCTELSKNIQIPGFRKGARIPPAVLEQTMAAKGGRNAIKVQAINELITQLVETTLREQDLDPIGQPRLSIPAEEMATTFVPGQPLTLSIACDVWPEITWKGPYTDLTGKYQRKPFDDAKLQTALNDLKERYVTLEPITDSSTDSLYQLQMGDACTVNMVGYMATPSGDKGEPLPNAASGDNVEVVLGKGRYMEGLVEGLVGAKIGDTVVVKVKFPEKLRDKTLAGKDAIFDVEVLDASKRTIPEVNDAFAAMVKPGLTKDALMAQLRKAIDDENSREFVPARNKALGEALAQVMDVEVPDTLVTNQAREKFAVMMAEMRDGGTSDEEIKRQINPENFLKYKDIVKDDIIRDFKISMATDEIARLEGIDVPDYQVEEQMEAIRKDADKDETFDENMIRSKVKNTLVRQAVMDWLAERSKLEVEYMDDNEPEFDEELLNRLAEESLERERAAAAAAGATTTASADVVAPKVAEASPPVVPVADSTPTEPAEPVAPAAMEKEEEPVIAAVATETADTTTTDAEVVHEKSSSAGAAAAAVIDPEYVKADLSLEEKAFRALVKSGAVQLNPDPNDPNYDHSADDEIVPGTVFKK